MTSPARDPQPSRSAFRLAAFGTVSGPALLTVGVGNVWRSRAGLLIGLVFVVAGLVLTFVTLRDQRRRARSLGGPVPPLSRQLLTVALSVLVGSAIYLGLLAFFDRS